MSIIPAGQAVLVELHNVSDQFEKLGVAAILFLSLEHDRSFELLRGIRSRHPDLIISVCTTDPSALAWPALARAGADDVTVLGDSFTAGIEQWIRDRLALPVPEVDLESLTATYGRFPATIAAWCLRNATRARPVAAVSEWFGLPPRTLRRRLESARLPKPDVLWRCGRILQALELESKGVRSKQIIATMVGYAGAPQLWNAKTALRVSAAHEPRLAHFLSHVGRLEYSLARRDDNGQ